MFLDFFLLLKNDGIPVTIREYLTFLEALDKDVVEYSVDDFYYLSRTALIKHEHHLDRFDILFGYFFEGIETIEMDEFMKIPEEWLKRSFNAEFTEEDKAMIKSIGGIDKLLERLKELMKTQKKKHEGGNKWIGTGGRSPFGSGGYNPEGIRMGHEGVGSRRAIKVWDQREFKDLDDGVELETRNMKMALRRLRILTREGTKEELDLDKTIDRTSRNAGLLELEMVAAKKNNVKVLLFLDIGGSMDDHIELCSRLFSAAKYEFKHLEHYYFHNCLYESVWRNGKRRRQEAIPTFDVLHKYNSDYKVIVVGDASMSPYEILYPNGSIEHSNDEAGLVWLERLKEQYSDLVWLNPVPVDEWRYTESIEIIQEFTGDRMFPLTMGGLQQAIKALKDKKIKFEKH